MGGLVDDGALRPVSVRLGLCFPDPVDMLHFDWFS